MENALGVLEVPDITYSRRQLFANAAIAASRSTTGNLLDERDNAAAMSVRFNTSCHISAIDRQAGAGDESSSAAGDTRVLAAAEVTASSFTCACFGANAVPAINPS